MYSVAEFSTGFVRLRLLVDECPPFVHVSQETGRTECMDAPTPFTLGHLVHDERVLSSLGGQPDLQKPVLIISVSGVRQSLTLKLEQVTCATVYALPDEW